MGQAVVCLAFFFAAGVEAFPRGDSWEGVGNERPPLTCTASLSLVLVIVAANTIRAIRAIITFFRRVLDDTSRHRGQGYRLNNYAPTAKEIRLRESFDVRIAEEREMTVVEGVRYRRGGVQRR